jgi:NADPH2:quinone reductase
MSDLPGARIGRLIGGNQSVIGFSLYGFVGDTQRLAQALGELIGWVLSGQLKVTVDDRFPLAEASAAHRAIADRKTTGKVVLEP